MSFQLKSIYHYIADNLFNELASFRMKALVDQKLSTISLFPNSGTSVSSYISDIADEFSDIRKINAKNYILLYSYDENEIDIATITHIFHQTQDYGKIFQNN